MNIIEALQTHPRCRLCAGRGHVPYRTRSGAVVRLVCACVKLFSARTEVQACQEA